MTHRAGYILVLLAGILWGAHAFGNRTDPHAPPEMQEPLGASASAVSVSGHGDTFEATLQYDVLRPGKTAQATLYVAEWATNVPVSGADVVLEITGPGLDTKRSPTPLDGAGRYTVDLSLPAAEPYAMLVEVNRGEEFDLFPIDGLQAAQATTEPESHDPHGHGLHLHTEEAAGMAAAGMLLLLAAYFFGHWQGRRTLKEVQG